jgi:bifunctional DNA-binding transcriptional regulator/antitoxin component of YhaV-PrlF toxin-antitoxin module
MLAAGMQSLLAPAPGNLRTANGNEKTRNQDDAKRAGDDLSAAIRARLGLRPKNRVRFDVDGDEVKHSPASSNLLAGFGAVTPHRRPEAWPAVEDAVQELIATDVALED